MRLIKFSALAVVALSLISTDTLASPVNRKFHPVVNDDPQNAHLNVQTPAADINQTVVFKEEPGPDGQVIPVGDTKVASCVAKDANGDIDLSGGSCSPSGAPAQVAERAHIAVSTVGQASSPSPRTASRPLRVPSPTSASIAPAGNMGASQSAPNRSTKAIEAVRVATPLPAQRTEAAHIAAASLPAKQPAPAAQAGAAPYGMTSMQWLEIAMAAAMLFALGLGLIFRMGLAHLLLMRRDEPHTDEERAAREGRTAVSAVVQDPLPSP
jgi:hypothetical protein